MLGKEDFMVIQALVKRGVYVCEIAVLLRASCPGALSGSGCETHPSMSPTDLGSFVCCSDPK